jgi:anti-sigma factor RsiW
VPVEVPSLRRSVDCETVSPSLSALADGEDVNRRVRHHVEACLRCQAEVARYRRLQRDLHALRRVPVPAHPSLVVDVLASIDAVPGTGRPHQVARTVAVAGGISVATAAAGAAGVLVWMSRRRLALAG